MKTLCSTLLLCASLLTGGTVRAQVADAACFWRTPRDLPLVETNARYWRGEFRLDPGERLEIDGHFPHARQMSFNVHRLSDNAALASARDVDIVPARGAINPFLPGARRDSRRRDYRLLIDGAPGQPAPGMVRVDTGGKGFEGRLLYRLYLPDRGRPGGGVPLPVVAKVTAGGERRPLGGTCPDPARVDPTQPTGPTRIPPAPGTAEDPIVWLGSATPSGKGSGDVLVNRDNAYAYAMTDFGKGEVLLLEGTAPTHARTSEGARIMGSGQVRYWSLCAYRHPSDRSADCLADEAIPLDRRGRYRVVVSPAGKRPANARQACGIGWIDAMTRGEGVLLLRHVAPAPTFANTPLKVAAGMPAASMLGPYEPRGAYTSREKVEALQCRSLKDPRQR